MRTIKIWILMEIMSQPKVMQWLVLFKQLWKTNIKQFSYTIECQSQSHTSTHTKRMYIKTRTNTYTHTHKHKQPQHLVMQLTHTYGYNQKKKPQLYWTMWCQKFYILFTKNAVQWESNCGFASDSCFNKRKNVQFFLSNSLSWRLNCVLWLHDIEWAVWKSI